MFANLCILHSLAFGSQWKNLFIYEHVLTHCTHWKLLVNCMHTLSQNLTTICNAGAPVGVSGEGSASKELDALPLVDDAVSTSSVAAAAAKEAASAAPETGASKSAAPGLGAAAALGAAAVAVPAAIIAGTVAPEGGSFPIRDFSAALDSALDSSF